MMQSHLSFLIFFFRKEMRKLSLSTRYTNSPGDPRKKPTREKFSNNNCNFKGWSNNVASASRNLRSTELFRITKGDCYLKREIGTFRMTEGNVFVESDLQRGINFDTPVQLRATFGNFNDFYLRNCVTRYYYSNSGSLRGEMYRRKGCVELFSRCWHRTMREWEKVFSLKMKVLNVTHLALALLADKRVHRASWI